MRFFGKIWFEETSESVPGVWAPTLIPREYIGDVNRYQRRWQNQEESINDSLNISNEISVIADSYMLENLGRMRCVEYGGSKWKIASITVQHPRVVLTISDLYTVEEDELEVDDAEG